MDGVVDLVRDYWNDALTIAVPIATAFFAWRWRRKVLNAAQDAGNALTAATTAQQQSAAALSQIVAIEAERVRKIAQEAQEAEERAQREQRAAQLTFRMVGTRLPYVQGDTADLQFRMEVRNEGKHSASDIAIEVLSCYQPSRDVFPARPVHPDDLRPGFDIPAGRQININFGTHDDQERGSFTFDLYEVRASWTDGNGRHTEKFVLPEAIVP